MAWLCARTVLQTCRRRISYSLACSQKKECKYSFRDESSVPHRFFTFSHYLHYVIFFAHWFWLSVHGRRIARDEEREKNFGQFHTYISVFLFLTVADPLDHATGLEKREMLAQLAGNEVSCDISTFRLAHLCGCIPMALLC